MSLAERISVINRGFFTPGYPAEQMKQILPDGTQEVVNWATVRPALLELDAMPWFQLQDEWRYFLDENRYPVGSTLELTPDRVNIFHSLTRSLRADAEEAIRVLASVHPPISAHDVTVAIDSKDLETIEAAVRHVRRVTELAAIDDAITVSSLQSGSLEIILTAGQLTLNGLNLAIVLAKLLKAPNIKADAQRLLQMLKRRHPDDDTSEEDALEIVHSDAKEKFWGQGLDALQTAFKSAGKGTPESNEAKNKIELAAKEIHDNADEVFAAWKLPPATVHGLPGGVTVNLNFDNPEAIGRVIRAIAAAPNEE